ncbi:hypothetical protein SO802_002588 [Lithocarpus litseifolius]|uniref:Zinc knuckle CX2CX4HX4C domain-containing protein n=1 Tax=Lithocarpus litseifolius TaxID=425828 RepID=A0AAW2E1F4_9ROSI
MLKAHILRSAVILDVVAISALIIYVTRVALGYKHTWDRYQLLVNKTLYEKTLASGFRSVHFLLDASEQQQLLVNKTLYEKTLASGFRSVHFLLDASEQQQEDTEPPAILLHIPLLAKDKQWKKGMTVENLRMEYASLCVQIWGVPLDMLSSQVAFEIGNRLGIVEEVERRQRQDELNFFMWVRVAFPIAKPLTCGAYIVDLDGARTWVKFKYERLPLFCFYCGFLRHDLKHCAKHFEAQKSGEGVEYQYGEWLKDNGGRSRSPSKRDMGKTEAGGAMDEFEDLLRQNENKLMHGRWKTEVTEQTQTGFSSDRSDNGRPDKEKNVIPGAVTEIQEVDSMDKGVMLT